MANPIRLDSSSVSDLQSEDYNLSVNDNASIAEPEFDQACEDFDNFKPDETDKYREVDCLKNADFVRFLKRKDIKVTVEAHDQLDHVSLKVIEGRSVSSLTYKMEQVLEDGIADAKDIIPMNSQAAIQKLVQKKNRMIARKSYLLNHERNQNMQHLASYGRACHQLEEQKKTCDGKNKLICIAIANNCKAILKKAGVFTPNMLRLCQSFKETRAMSTLRLIVGPTLQMMGGASLARNMLQLNQNDMIDQLFELTNARVEKLQDQVSAVAEPCSICQISDEPPVASPNQGDMMVLSCDANHKFCQNCISAAKRANYNVLKCPLCRTQCEALLFSAFD